MPVEISNSLRVFAVGVLLAISQVAFAQPKPASPQPPPPPPPTKEQRQAEDLRLILGASDKEWQVLAPKVEKVLSLQRERERFIGKPKVYKAPRSYDAKNTTPPPAGFRGIDVNVESKKDADAGTTNAQLADCYAKLAAMASDGSASADEMAAALREFRAAQADSDAELAKARSELRELVTVKQEVALVLMKVLD